MPKCALTALLIGMVSSGEAAEMRPEQRAFFESKIRPVLVQQCYECHAAGAKKLGGKLLLDAPSEMLAGGESGPVLIPGKPDESLIIQALRYEDPEMPPKQRLPDSVIQDFVTWVQMGAPDPRMESAKSAKPKVPADKSALWSYHPVRHPTAPVVKAAQWPRDSIDNFVLAKIEAAGLAPTKDADAATLIRRLSFDLIGLPPTADEVDAFVQDFAHSASAYERLVDRLLQSSHFGERWGRHWLDVARFAESNGNDGLSRNPSFPHAWRYRDYVIESFNQDVPYDRFITEQIAGDLLPAGTPAQRDRQLIATGFLALGAKPAKAMNDNFEMDVVADQIGVIGSGILGLSVGCARCHDHKFDPISAREYYALAGIFKSTETLWGAAGYEGLTAPQTPLHELLAAQKMSIPSEAERAAFNKRSDKKPAAPVFKYPPGSPLAMGARESKTIADCKLNIDGDSKKLGAVVTRGFIEACGITGTEKIDAKQSGRLQLAQWLTNTQHPQTARVMVNRVWQHLLGTGLVSTPDDFGVYGAKPSHPELLDALAARFMAEGWSIKRLIRHLVLTHTYQLSSEGNERLRKLDPENQWLARHNRQRLDAEAVRDAMLATTGELNEQPGQGSLIQSHEVLINQLGNLHKQSNHRSVYLLMLRNSMPPELTPFNLPDALAVTGKRDAATMPTQALYLLNNAFVVKQSQRFATRLRLLSNDNAQRIARAYRQAFARAPQEAEIHQALAFIRESEANLMSSFDKDSAREQAVWAAYCQALLASNELRYVD